MAQLSFSTKLIQLNNKTAGKDKIYRTVQYTCKLVWYILWKTKSNKEYIEILKKLESTMSMTRKILRFGKSHDMLESATKSIHIDDDFLRYVLTASSINQGLYLILDNALLLDNFGIIKLKRYNEISEWSNKFWLFSSILYLARDLYDILAQIETNRIRLKENSNYIGSSSSGNSNKMSPRSSSNNNKKLIRFKLILKHLHLLFKSNPNLMLDTAKNVFDVILPLSFLKFINVSPGTQGFVGMMSSILALITVWDSKYKLTP